MKIYEILPNLYLGRVMDHPDSDPGIPYGFTRTGIEVPEGKYAFWSGTEWVLTEHAVQEKNSYNFSFDPPFVPLPVSAPPL